MRRKNKPPKGQGLSHLSLANMTLGSILYRKNHKKLELKIERAYWNAMKRNDI
jgi:hypothetical protein